MDVDWRLGVSVGHRLARSSPSRWAGSGPLACRRGDTSLRLSTLLGGQLIVTIALFALYSGVLSVLLPQQVAALVPGDKVAALAVVTSVSFGVTAFAQPLFGILSDRTRSRWGRRVPWLVGCAAVGGGLVVLLPVAPTVGWLVVLWAAAQFVLNGTDIAVSAYLIDGFPPRRRGVVTGVLGVGVVVGGLLGVVAAGLLGAPWGYRVLAGVLAAVVVGFAVAVRDGPSRLQSAPAETVQPRGRITLDAVWVLASRLVFTLGYASVHGYLLYILIDHIKVPQEQGVAAVGLATLIGGGGLIVAVLGGGALSDRLGRRKPFVIAAGVVVAAGDAMLLAVPSTAGLLVAALLLGVGLGLSVSAGTALASVIIPRPDRNAGGGLGFLNFVGNAGQALAPLVTAALVAATGGYIWVFVISGSLALVASGLVALVRSAR